MFSKTFHSFNLALYQVQSELYEVWQNADSGNIEKIDRIADPQNPPKYLKGIQLP